MLKNVIISFTVRPSDAKRLAKFARLADKRKSAFIRDVLVAYMDVIDPDLHPVVSVDQKPGECPTAQGEVK